MLPIAEALKAYTHSHPFDPRTGDDETVLDQLYRAYCDSHESDPPEITSGFKELGVFLESHPQTASPLPQSPEGAFRQAKTAVSPRIQPFSGHSSTRRILAPRAVSFSISRS